MRSPGFKLNVAHRKLRAIEVLATDIYAITAEEYSLGRSNLSVVVQMLQAEIKVIQYREKEKEKRRKYEECLSIRKLTSDAGAAFIVNDDVDLAILVKADGIHIGQEDLPPEMVRKLVGKEMLIGMSTHSPDQARDAVARGVDYIGVGPVFATQTKKNVCDPAGLEYVEFAARNVPIPFVAIGGIKENNIAKVAEAGAKCFALVTEIVGAPDIGRKISDIRRALRNASFKV